MARTSTHHLIEPDLRAFVEDMPPFVLTEAMLSIVRENFAPRLNLMESLEALQRVQTTRVSIPGPRGAPEVGAVLYQPEPADQLRGAILHLHGGGYISGEPFGLIPMYRQLALELDCVMLSVDYRLAPENPYPAAIEDSYAALAWLYREGKRLNVDPARIGVMGESSGGGLAAALALLARDRGEHALAFQHLIYPMLDDRTCITEAPNAYAGEFIWTRENNRFGWRCLLGLEPGSGDVSPYAAPARAEDLCGLPPTFISTGALDLFVDEDLEYARRLIRAGVRTELHVYPGAYHGFHLVPGSRTTLTAQRDALDALKKELAT
jgi:triacylglycerol lipase